MDQETRDAFAALTLQMTAGFTRVDHFIELMQGQFVDQRADVSGLTLQVQRLVQRVDRVEAGVQGLRAELQAHRDWTALEFVSTRAEIRSLRAEVARHRDDCDERIDAVRLDLDQLTDRVDRLEARVDAQD